MSQRGSGPKPARFPDELDIVYSKSHWQLLARMRKQAVQVMESLGAWKTSALVHGSLARGDVDEKSDIDIIIPIKVSTQMIETSLGLGGFEVASREIVQATPMHSPKAHLFLDPEQAIAVTVPLATFRTLEEEFYAYGGTTSINELQAGVRKKGCTKKLTLVIPNESGHKEWSIVNREAEAAEILGIKLDIVRERVRVLGRRDQIGRTGNFLNLPVAPGMSFEEVLEQESLSNPALRRTLRKRQRGNS